MLIPIQQAQADLESLIARSATGEDIVITQGGMPVAKVVPVSATQVSAGVVNGHEGQTPGASESVPAERQLGWAKGLITLSPDFDEPLEEFREYME